MSFTGLRLSNFKCFADSGEIRLAPLTFLFGRNNSGKSSVLQSLFLLRQSLDAPTYGPRLSLDGHLYAAGTYKDIVHLHGPSRKLSFTISLSLQDEEQAHLELAFAGKDPQPPRLDHLAISGEGHSLGIWPGPGHGGPYHLWIGETDRGGEAKAKFSFPVNGFFPLLGDEPPQIGRPSQARKQTREFSRRVLRQVEDLLRGIRVIGPFRAPPERRYEFKGSTPPSVDATGRDVVNALIESSLAGSGKRARGELLHAVNRWLEKVARVKLLPMKAMDRAGKLFELELRDTESGRFANFADVGFGIGQALPVLVEGLRTPKGGAFIVQEPEINLHPDAQLAMADFLFELSQSGRQVIVETHSEHVLLRIRRRLLSDTKKGIISQEHVSMIYIGTDTNGAGRAIPLKLDELAQIENWPAGFFQEATSERMALLAAMAARGEAGE